MTAAQLLNLSIDEYHELEAFSSSTAKMLHLQSPAHAKAGFRKKPTKAMERGDVIHKLVLGKGKDFAVLNFADYKKDAAKEARDAAREQGLVPILAHQLETARAAAEAIIRQLAERGIVLDGLSEQPITWVEHTEFGDVRCKAMFDHVWPDRGLAIDIKTTEDASPLAVERTAENFGYGIQHAAYRRALTALSPDLAGKVGLALVFCEHQEEPFAINVCEPDGVFAELGERRWLRSVATWARCTRDNHWPTYGDAINPISAPPWALAREGYATGER